MGAKILARGYKIGTLYITTNIRDQIDVADVNTNSKLLHLRLGHMSDKEKLPELKLVEFELCE
jgi:hypothetical protein